MDADGRALDKPSSSRRRTSSSRNRCVFRRFWRAHGWIPAFAGMTS